MCRSIAEQTSLAVSFTTHGHRVDAELADALRGSAQFIRVSVDGVESTYERIRGRSFAALTEQIKLIDSIAPFGINMVVTEETINELDACLAWAESVGAREFLLLAEQPAKGRPGLPAAVHPQLTDWIAAAKPGIRLAVGAAGAVAEMGLADPFGLEPPLEAHAHVDASGYLRPDAYSMNGVRIGSSITDALYDLGEELAA
jgi:MoaA/NifB/PqqE/SkfB family radical SAM enzyme